MKDCMIKNELYIRPPMKYIVQLEDEEYGKLPLGLHPCHVDSDRIAQLINKAAF